MVASTLRAGDIIDWIEDELLLVLNVDNEIWGPSLIEITFFCLLRQERIVTIWRAQLKVNILTDEQR